MKRLFVITGANGHLGNTVVKKLVENGEQVRALVLPGEQNAALDDTKVQIIFGDVCDMSSLQALFHVDAFTECIVIHAAGVVVINEENQQRVYDVNVSGTANIVTMCLRHKVKRLLYVSSVHAIPEKRKGEVIREVGHFSPDEVVGLYAKTKAQATQIVLDSIPKGLDAVIVHPSGIIGPGDYGAAHTTQFIIDYCRGGLTAGIKGGYDFVDVRDVAEGIVSAAERGLRGNCYILSNIFATIEEVFDMLDHLDHKCRIKIMLPLWFAQSALPLSRLYYKIRRTKPLYTKYSLYTLQSNAIFSCEKAKTELQYKTRHLQETLQDTVNWLAENDRIKR